MVLLVPYDPLEPFNNLITAIKCKPDIMLIFGNVNVSATENEYKRKAVRLGLRNTEVRVLACDVYNLENMVSVLDDCIKEYGANNCILDATGGEERLLFAAGYLCRSKTIPVVLYSLTKKSFRCLNGKLPPVFEDSSFKLTAALRIEINNGRVLHDGHVDSDNVNKEFWKIANDMFFVYMKNRSRWPSFVQYMQQVLQNYDISDKKRLTFSSPKKIRMNNGYDLRIDSSIVSGLKDAGAITDVSINNGTVRLKLASHDVQKSLMDTGAWLELYLYTQLKQCTEIDDVQLNQVISWDRNDERTVNELDIIATSGASVFFISCKTGTPNMNMLYEIKTMAQRFGGMYSIPVLAVTCNMVKNAPALLRRAAVMGVVILDEEDLVRSNPSEELMTESRKLLASYSW